ncbi:substrate-binding domain-containing protein [Phenylobacterium terrae]|uniref:Substrate-binding domain-containing protein n=1 Tax=Phenylobacterium terrae TaxID=2665495 RepID=A0ABW4N2Z9_9CAUL
MRLISTLAAASAALALAGCGQGGDANKQAAGAPGGEGAAGGGGGSADQVWVAGSSTVFPFATRVSEQVSRTTGGTAAKVESLGTGGGIKLFCGGVGANYPDVATASRQMKKSEWDACQQAGVTDIVELKVGYDGIVVANARNGADYNLNVEHLYKALAAEVPAGQGFAPNAAKTWRDVDPSLPADRIQVYGPPPTSGTRDAFVELAMEPGAQTVPALKALKGSDENAFKQRAHTLRSDGAWIDSGENDNAIIQTLEKTPGSVGVFGFSFLQNNLDKVKPASVGGVQPTLAAISDGSYPLSRSLYIYVKKANVASKPALQPYVTAFVSDAAAGRGGYLLERGLIPLPDAERKAQQAAAQNLTPMAAPKS